MRNQLAHFSEMEEGTASPFQEIVETLSKIFELANAFPSISQTSRQKQRYHRAQLETDCYMSLKNASAPGILELNSSPTIRFT